MIIYIEVRRSLSFHFHNGLIPSAGGHAHACSAHVACSLVEWHVLEYHVSNPDMLFDQHALHAAAVFHRVGCLKFSFKGGFGEPPVGNCSEGPAGAAARQATWQGMERALKAGPG